MISKKIILGTLGGIVVLASASSFAAQMQVGTDDMIAREASEGPRGGDNERPGDRQRRGGRLSVDNPSDLIIAREATEGPRGRDRVHTGTHKNGIDTSKLVIAREASEGPRGGDNERPGDRQRRGGRIV
jgi:hypothetical protein